MNEGNLYRELLAWLRMHHPQVLAQWESERQRPKRRIGDTRPMLGATSRRSGSAVEQLPPDASKTAIVKAIQEELETLGIGGGTPGVNQDGTPCVHLTKKGLYGQAYEESVTLARIRDREYRRHLREVFG